MKGTMIVIHADKKIGHKTTHLDRRVELAELQAGVGGYIETVPGLTSYNHEGRQHRCFAFCNEEGKLKQLPRNERATQLWHRARRSGSDFLCGDVVIVFGDKEFMDWV